MKNEQIKEAQETKKREAEKKKKEMEEQRQAELKRKLDAELAAQKTAGEVRRKFCLCRTLKHRIRALNLNIPCLSSNFHLVIPQHFICKAVSRKYPLENLNGRYLWRNHCCGVKFSPGDVDTKEGGKFHNRNE